LREVSAVAATREQLEAALDFVREGDSFIVTKLDRLARSVPVCELEVLDQAIDTSTPTGRLMFNLLGSIAQFERELTRERMLVGIAKARSEGKYKGRAPTARAKADKVRELRDAGVRPAEIARQVGISRTSVYRVLG
jgi:DNA invertase Pin-like site-specific DNA recombinase